MPLFDWTNNVAVTHNFWLYWALTLPFTLMVFLAWTLSLWWREQTQREEADTRNAWSRNSSVSDDQPPYTVTVEYRS
ncbi:hypothetical protein CALCODRAFT_498424 [Calocera cornea HHB12733]|uniref:Uncharacterized protein n=1 Tax=Calocera cornea HHB12733 TaxID=1353952 RepID=A0A165EWC9_9BASI|nr:hypothetical protein CALCODRAFT_498424 [Calocera cornea HHB12733]